MGSIIRNWNQFRLLDNGRGVMSDNRPVTDFIYFRKGINVKIRGTAKEPLYDLTLWQGAVERETPRYLRVSADTVSHGFPLLGLTERKDFEFASSPSDLQILDAKSPRTGQ